MQSNQLAGADRLLSKLPQFSVALAKHLLGFLAPHRPDLDSTADGSPGWNQTRERLLTGVLRVGSIAGTLTFLIGLKPLQRTHIPPMLWFQLGIMVVIWILALWRTVSYPIRGTLLVATLYLFGLNELVNVGYGEDGHAFLTAFSLLALLFFGKRAGAAALALSVATLTLFGWMIASGNAPAFTQPSHPINDSTIITTAAIFLTVIGTIQVGITVLLNSLQHSWQREHAAREALERERDLLEQRVAERTRELAQAHEQALAASRHEATQNAFLATLHHTTLDLLNHRSADELFQTIVERAAAILDAPYSELMLKEGDTLVVHATTPNQAFLLGQRAQRHEARLSWQAHDTRQPVALDDYAAWGQRHAIYDGLPLRAVADFPIVIGAECLGVLALGRTEPGRTFTPAEIEQGQLFAQLTALVLESTRLYDTALREIAERTQAEAALQQFAQELQTQNIELDAFAHTVAHDLKIPLTSVIGYSQLLQISYQHMEPEQIEELLEIIAGTGQKMNTIINELLLLARVRTLESVPITRVPMERVIGEVEKRLHSLIAESQATIIKPERWPVAVGHAPWVEEVWANYLSNAIKYGGRPPQIVLGADPPEGGLVRFWVLDNGSGLSEEQRAKLFAPFTRLDESRAKGHGLGLSIVERIAKKLGGSVGVESEPGMGCCFFFTLPAEQTAAALELVEQIA